MGKSIKPNALVWLLVSIIVIGLAAVAVAVPGTVGRR